MYASIVVTEVYFDVKVKGSKSTLGEPSHSLYVERLPVGYIVATVSNVCVMLLTVVIVDHVSASIAVIAQLIESARHLEYVA